MADASLREVFELLTGRTDAEGNRLGERRELTRRRIVDATTTKLMEVGYRGMRVDEVCALAKVTRPTLYTYFESKEHLLVAAMAEEGLQQLASAARLFDPSRPAEERLRDVVKQTVAYIERAPLSARMARDREPEVLRILMEHELARAALGLNPELDKGRLFAGLVQKAFPGAFSDDEASEIASLLRALSHMAPALLDGHAMFGLSVERMADLLSQLLVDGLAARRG